MRQHCGHINTKPAAAAGGLPDRRATGVSINVNLLGNGTTRLSPSQLLEVIATAGFRYIQVPNNDPPWLALASRVFALGLKAGHVHGSLSSAACSLLEQPRRQAVADETKQMRAAAVYAPCPYVIHYLPRYNDPKRREAFRQSVAEMLTVAADLQFTLAVETVPYKPDKDERYADSGEVAAFVRSFQSDHLQACIDLNHTNLNENLPEAIRQFTGIIACVHISDNHGKKEEHLLPGDGIIDFPPAIKALRQAGFMGPLNLEVLVPPEDNRNPAEILLALRMWLEEHDELTG